jgi:plastocyanin
MTWPLPICSSSRWGSRAAIRLWVSGLLALSCSAVDVPGRVELADSRLASVRRHKNYSGVVVWLESPLTAAKIGPGSRAEMLQKGKTFQPHVLAIPVGTTVDFPNVDPIFHNAFSNFSGQPFDVGLYPPGKTRSVHFRREGIVRVFCNIHPTMSAIIAVLNTPYFAVTERNGEFRISGVPPGDYRLRFFHERAAAEMLDRLERPLKVDAAGVTIPLVTISESGFIAVPHKNKYGKDYPPETEDHILYPGAKK